MSARQVASVAGSIICLGLPLGNITRLMTRNMYYVVNHRITWGKKLKLPNSTAHEIEFWSENLKLLPKVRIIELNKISAQFFVDASAFGFLMFYYCLTG